MCGKKLLKKHRLNKIIKLPENTFPGVGVITSIFIFTAGEPQSGREIFACYIADDGLVTVKNQGRQDVHNRWPAIEDEWIKIIHRQTGHETIQWLDPEEHMSWQAPVPPFEITEKDFIKVVMDYELFQRGINEKELAEELGEQALYGAFENGEL